jgi:hypothetical protein
LKEALLQFTNLPLCLISLIPFSFLKVYNGLSAPGADDPVRIRIMNRKNKNGMIIQQEG